MGTERDIQGGEQAIHLAIHALPIDAPETVAGMTAHEDILGNVQIGEKHRLLLDNGDATSLGLKRRAQFNRLTANLDSARVWPVDARQNLHQRTLARAILANE